MSKKFFSFLLFFLVSVFLCFSINSSACADFSLNITKDKVEVTTSEKNISLSMENKQSYKLYSNNFSVLAYHVFFNDYDNITIILNKSYDERMYTAEVLIYLDDSKESCLTFLQELTSTEYDTLITNSESIYFESELGFLLRMNQQKFDENYSIEKERNQIDFYSIEKNNKSIEEMTKTDSYLNAYYPTNITETGYPIAYHDNIINLVPEQWFYTPGEKIYLGKEYGVYLTTSRTHHGFFNCDCYKSFLTIWDFESTIPCLSETNNGTNETFASFEGYKLSISNTIEYSYCAFKRSEMDNNTWKSYFDSSESSIIVKTEDSFKKVYIAPKDFGFAIDDDVPYNSANVGFKISSLKYELSVDTNIDQKLNNLKIKTFVSRSLAQLIGFIGSPAAKISAAIAKGVIGFNTAYEKAKIDGYSQDLTGNVNSMSMEYDYTGNRDVEGRTLSPVSIAMSHNSFSTIFSNPLLNNYEHKYEIKFNDSDLSKDYYFSFIDYCTFDIYDSTGKIISTKTRQVEFVSLSPIFDGTHIVRNINYSDNVTATISKAGTTSIFVIKPNQAGIYRFACNNSDLMIEIFNNKGDIIAQTNRYDFESACCSNLKANERYIVRCHYYRENEIGVESVRIEYVNTMYTINNDLTRIAVSSGQKTFYFPATLIRGGIYTFTTSSPMDTTIRLYDENGYLLGESFDPNADYSEDYPDLGANLSFYSRGRSRKVIIEVSCEEKSSYNLNISYRSS